MAHLLKDLLRQASAKAQEAFNIDEEKTKNFVSKADGFVDLAGQKLEYAEKTVNSYEKNLKERLKAAKEAFLRGQQNQQESPTNGAPQTTKPRSHKK